MVRQTLIEVLQKIPWFQNLSPDHFKKMAEIATEVEWKEGDIIFREGDQDKHLYMVVHGQVALEIYLPGQGRITILTLGPAEVFGWSAVTPVVGTRTATARAACDTCAVAFDSEALRRLCDEDSQLGYLVYRRITNVIAGRLTVTRLQLINMYAIKRE